MPATWNSGSSPSTRCSTIHDVVELSTTEPRIGACMSPMISSRENSTAAIGVLNAAASAADAPTGMSQRTCAVLSPSRRAITDAIPAPMCTDGPSRPSAMPLASDVAAADEFPDDRAERDAAVVDEDRRSGLRNAAAARVGKETEEQIAR